jgi:hypothetical protein
MPGRSIACLLILLASGCTRDGATSWQGEVRDSAGVRIVENTGRGSWSQDRGWRVTQDLSIGRAEGEAAYLFGRVADVAVDAAGRLPVLDQQAQAVRVFDAAGQFSFAMGGPGRGPGELSAFANAVLVSPLDTVFVPDYVQARINVYDPSGAYVRAIVLRPPPSRQLGAAC